MNQEIAVPVLGERGDIADNELPVQALRLSQNVFRNEKGLLVVRPGYDGLASTSPGGRIMGLGYFRTATGSERQLAANMTSVWQFTGTTWTDITGTPLTGTILDHVQFTIMSVSGVYNAIISNGKDATKIWDGTAGSYSDLGGSPGVFIDTVVCGNRLLGLKAPNQIRVSEFNNPNVWPSDQGFTINLIDSGDLMVGMDAVSKNSVLVLGEESQWIVSAQSGQNPMRPSRMSQESGPMSAAVIVVVGGIAYYLADDYNVYKVDVGNSLTTPIGWAMKAWIQSTISVSNKKQAHGAYFDRIGKIFWFFPGASATGPQYGIHYDVRTGEMGRLYYSNRFITASGRVRVIVTVTWADLTPFTWDNLAATYPTWDSFGDPGVERRTALGSADGMVYVAGVGDGSDDGTPIEALWEIPLKSYAGWPVASVPATFETFFQQTTNSTVAELSVGSTDTLMGALEYSLMDSFDLATAQRNDIDLSSVGEKRFVTVRHRVIAPKGQVAWNGGVFNFEKAEVNKGATGDGR